MIPRFTRPCKRYPHENHRFFSRAEKAMSFIRFSPDCGFDGLMDNPHSPNNSKRFSGRNERKEPGFVKLLRVSRS